MMEFSDQKRNSSLLWILRTTTDVVVILLFVGLIKGNMTGIDIDINYFLQQKKQ